MRYRADLVLLPLIFSFIMVLGLPAWAWSEPLPVWNCSATVNLTGHSYFFLQYGRDSWNGMARLNCHYNGRSTFKVVRVTFNGSEKGYGASQSSVIKMQLDLATSTPPEDILLWGFVANQAPSPGIFWRFESRSSLIEATVTKVESADAQRSLQNGVLYIR